MSLMHIFWMFGVSVGDGKCGWDKKEVATIVLVTKLIECGGDSTIILKAELKG